MDDLRRKLNWLKSVSMKGRGRRRRRRGQSGGRPRRQRGGRRKAIKRLHGHGIPPFNSHKYF